MRTWTAGLGALLCLAGASKAQAATPCEQLGALTLPHTTITLAKSLPAGAFTPPGAGARDTVDDIPAVCRIAVTLAPSSDSDIRVEVWLPANGWNGKYQAVGNGGWAGSINYAAMADAVKRGYATSSTDTGHVGGSGSFALGHPEKVIDFAYRSEHEMATTSKTLIAAFYGAEPRYSYWNGCSSGGRQGLKLAERFPADFDGVIAGDSANPSPLLNTWQLHVARAVHKDEASYIPRAKYQAIHKAALAACDARDGIADGLISAPLGCRLDPAVLACSAGDTAACLTAPQVAAARALLNPMLDASGKTELSPGIEAGSELDWASVAGEEPNSIAVDYFKYVVTSNADWDWKAGAGTFESDLRHAERVDNGLQTASPQLDTFAARGGKLLMYHGWSDPRVPPRYSIDYFESASRRLGDSASTSIRLFMVPGLGHCRGGEGYNTFDLVSELEGWVERGVTPAVVPASRVVNGSTERTGVLCAFPQVAKYTGAGNGRDAASFSCSLP